MMRVEIETATLEDLMDAEAFGESFGLRAWWLDAVYGDVDALAAV